MMSENMTNTPASSLRIRELRNEQAIAFILAEEL